LSIGYLPALTMPWLISFLSREMTYSSGGAGAIVTMQLALLAATTIVLGSQIQRVNRRRAALLGAMAVVACGLGLLAKVPATVLLVLLAAAGVGCGACNAAGASLVSQGADPVRMTSSLWTWTVAWQTVVWLATPLAFEQWGGRGLGLVFALGGLVMVPWLLRMPLGVQAAAVVPPSQSGVSERGPSPKPHPVIGAMPAVFIVLVAGVAAFWLRDSIIWSLAEARGAQLSINASQLSQTLTIGSILGILGPVAANYLCTRGRRGATLLLALVLIAIVMQLIATTHSASAYRLGFLFWTATSLFAWTYLMALAAAVDAAGRVVAVCSGVVFAAAAFGPLLGGVLIDRGGEQALPIVVMVLSALTIAAVLITLRNSPTGDTP
jgi:predicted MFS family arabinose efflux permease